MATLSNVRILLFVSFRSVLTKCARELGVRAAIAIAAPTLYCDRSSKAGKEERLCELLWELTKEASGLHLREAAVPPCYIHVYTYS